MPSVEAGAAPTQDRHGRPIDHAIPDAESQRKMREALASGRHGAALHPDGRRMSDSDQRVAAARARGEAYTERDYAPSSAAPSDTDDASPSTTTTTEG